MDKPLAGTMCYLSGAIEHNDYGTNWRTVPTKVLKEKFKINVFDPFEDPKQKWSDKLKKAQAEQNYDEMVRIAQNFVQKDLSIIDRCDFLIGYLPYKVPTTGTIHEIIHANNIKKPVLLICPEGKQFIPLWFYGFIDVNTMFGQWNDLYNYLQEVDNAQHTSNRRWNLIYGLV